MENIPTCKDKYAYINKCEDNNAYLCVYHYINTYHECPWDKTVSRVPRFYSTVSLYPQLIYHHGLATLHIVTEGYVSRCSCITYSISDTLYGSCGMSHFTTWLEY